ncbi:MAG: hypothetical protein WKH64_16470, partial [Chloroflexia bacterium]
MSRRGGRLDETGVGSAGRRRTTAEEARYLVMLARFERSRRRRERLLREAGAFALLAVHDQYLDARTDSRPDRQETSMPDPSPSPSVCSSGHGEGPPLSLYERLTRFADDDEVFANVSLRLY